MEAADQRNGRAHRPEARQLRDHGVRAAVSVPLHEAGTGGYGTLSFIGFGAEREFDDWLHGLKSRLVGLAYLFHQGVQDERPLLSPRECECLGLTATGLSAKEIARNNRATLNPESVDGAFDDRR